MTEDIIDIYNTRDYDLMVSEIDKREDFFIDLKDDLDNRCTHDNDFTIFSDITAIYHMEKDLKEEEKQAKVKEDKLYLLKQFSNWLISDFDTLEINIKDYDFINSLDDFLDSELTGEKL